MAAFLKFASKTISSDGQLKSLLFQGSSPLFTKTRQFWNAHLLGTNLLSGCNSLTLSPFLLGTIQKRNITLLTTFKVVDNSALGKSVKKNRKPYLIGFYRKRKTADPGDVIRVAVAGKTNKAVVIGTRKTKHHTIPRYDNNCIVLVDDNLAPLGTRIKAPIPTILRKRQEKLSKVLALATRFI
ncbi:39S ribosomal protein L14, mitochondrial-like [Stylophora pistillata]|uniref:Large ribosomal subunit protein uL14m n=1 Tax=Stylophora pistillata TaxID=50429 RepID=A0A2B4RV66_STYPI|nr:39S ribosomal protein L14, mitochondrial-like [Stylophora pistillata]PFX21066.1 39S ribosomal protein L14, mitochondrial [Stylophora pistillata]